MNPIPKPVIEVVEAARKAVLAYRQMRHAKELGANDEKMKERRRALDRSLQDLEKVVVRLEKLLAAQRRTGAAATFDWNAAFRVGGKLLDLINKEVHQGGVKRQDVEEFIDVEVVGEPRRS